MTNTFLLIVVAVILFVVGLSYLRKKNERDEIKQRNKQRNQYDSLLKEFRTKD